MLTLTQYITSTRRLLHDANGTFFSDSELTDYINAGRKRVAIDCGFLRYLETISLTAGQETYTLSSVASKGANSMDLLNVTVLWGSTRIPLQYAPWTQFNAYFRTWQTNQSRPAIWSNYGSGPTMTFYIQPVPDQTYTCYLDTIYVPNDLVTSTDADEVVYPFSDAVPYYAAKTAKYKEQNYGEASLFEQQYKEKAAWALNAVYTRRLPDPYNQYGAW